MFGILSPAESTPEQRFSCKVKLYEKFYILLLIAMDDAETRLEARGLGHLNFSAGRGRDSDVDSSHTGCRDVEHQRQRESEPTDLVSRFSSQRIQLATQ